MSDYANEKCAKLFSNRDGPQSERARQGIFAF
jgi:hypothetical protein